MNIHRTGRFVGVIGLTAGLIVSAAAQVTLTGTNYTQTFNSISSGLPPGWSVRTNATATSLGQPASFPTAGKTWGDNIGAYGSCAATVSNTGTNFNGMESATIQGNCTNRVLAIRQTSVFGDPGAAFVFQIANTTGFSNFTFSVDLSLLKPNGFSTTWNIEYAIGDSPSSFTLLGTYSDPGTFSTTNRTFTLGTDADNQPNNVWIRIAALSNATGSGTRDTFGMDNFVLNYSKAATTVTLVPLFLQTDGKNAVLTWNDSAFSLQASPSVDGTYTNVSEATSPFTNALDAPAKFFRLIH
jgi:hypothetical protein